MDEQRIQEIAERASRATPGPWEWKKLKFLGGGLFSELAGAMGVTVIEEELWDEGYRGIAVHPRNADLIAHAPEDIPDLLAALAEARAHVGELEGEVERLKDLLSRHHDVPWMERQVKSLSPVCLICTGKH